MDIWILNYRIFKDETVLINICLEFVLPSTHTFIVCPLISVFVVSSSLILFRIFAQNVFILGYK